MPERDRLPVELIRLFGSLIAVGGIPFEGPVCAQVNCSTGEVLTAALSKVVRPSRTSRLDDMFKQVSFDKAVNELASHLYWHIEELRGQASSQARFINHSTTNRHSQIQMRRNSSSSISTHFSPSLSGIPKTEAGQSSSNGTPGLASSAIFGAGVSGPFAKNRHPAELVLLWRASRSEAGQDIRVEMTTHDAMRNFRYYIDATSNRKIQQNEAIARASSLRENPSNPYGRFIMYVHLIATGQLPLDGPYCAQPGCRDSQASLSAFQISDVRRKLIKRMKGTSSSEELMLSVVDQLWGHRSVFDAAMAVEAHITSHLEQLLPEKYAMA